MSSTQVTVTRSRPASDDYTLHELSDPRFVIWEKPHGRDRFEVMECGAGRRGMGRSRGNLSSLAAALELAGTLTPSTPAEILSGFEVYGDLDRKQHAKLIALGTPGTPLFVLADGGGYESVSEGLATNAVEALFGGDDELSCWLISWRDPQGELVKGMYCMAREDAERAWWILRDGKVVAGGPNIFDETRAHELAEQFGGTAVKGTGWSRPDAAPVTSCLRCGHGLRSAASISRGYSLRCWRLERSEARERARAEAVAIAAAPFGKLVVPAGKLIEDGKLTLLRPGIWSAESSDKRRSYTATAYSCECKAAGFGNYCKHRCAAAMATAYLEFGETFKAAA